MIRRIPTYRYNNNTTSIATLDQILNQHIPTINTLTEHEATFKALDALFADMQGVYEYDENKCIDILNQHNIQRYEVYVAIRTFLSMLCDTLHITRDNIDLLSRGGNYIWNVLYMLYVKHPEMQGNEAFLSLVPIGEDLHQAVTIFIRKCMCHVYDIDSYMILCGTLGLNEQQLSSVLSHIVNIKDWNAIENLYVFYYYYDDNFGVEHGDWYDRLFMSFFRKLRNEPKFKDIKTHARNMNKEIKEIIGDNKHRMEEEEAEEIKKIKM